MCLPPACFEIGFGFVSGFEEGYNVVEEFFRKIPKLTKLPRYRGGKIYAF